MNDWFFYDKKVSVILYKSQNLSFNTQVFTAILKNLILNENISCNLVLIIKRSLLQMVLLTLFTNFNVKNKNLRLVKNFRYFSYFWLNIFKYNIDILTNKN